MFRKLGMLGIVLMTAIAMSSVASAMTLIPWEFFSGCPDLLQVKTCNAEWTCGGGETYPVDVCVCKYPWEGIDWGAIIDEVMWNLGTLALPPDVFNENVCIMTLSTSMGESIIECATAACPTDEDMLTMIYLWSADQVDNFCVLDMIDKWSSGTCVVNNACYNN
ncbi:MAG: hypothetical protein L6243_00400 [Candidatus Altiarchaeales archaeon]|nr:hypothetical protein [Candidatus Altiarchaeota archaeon]MCG2782028.1 hypothetical protein [Candidatus Altiarchaeales archaeon]